MIDADGIRKKAVPHTRGNYGYSADIRKWAVLVGDIDDAPTIDAVPVVRCKDCIHSTYDEIFGQRWCDSHSGCRKVNDDGFCDWGERKEGAD